MYELCLLMGQRNIISGDGSAIFCWTTMTQCMPFLLNVVNSHVTFLFLPFFFEKSNIAKWNVQNGWMHKIPKVGKINISWSSLLVMSFKTEVDFIIYCHIISFLFFSLMTLRWVSWYMIAELDQCASEPVALRISSWLFFPCK